MSSPAAPAQATAFDPAPYDLPIPKIDGLKADRLAVSFAGTIELDRTDQDDLDLINGLRLGRDVPLEITATCVGKPQSYQPREDEPGIVTHRAVLRIHTIRR